MMFDGFHILGKAKYRSGSLVLILLRNIVVWRIYLQALLQS
jgi:hypothetical protein